MSAAQRPARRRTKAKAPVLSLVPYVRSEDTIGCLQELLGEALRGELVGLAFAAQYRGRKYIVDAAGEAWRNPTFAAGMATQLANCMARNAWGNKST